jgi:hypothetical protein
MAKKKTAAQKEVRKAVTKTKQGNPAEREIWKSEKPQAGDRDRSE